MAADGHLSYVNARQREREWEEERKKQEMDREKRKRPSNSKDSETLSLAETLTERGSGSPIQELPVERLSNHEALSDLCERIEDWKGYDVATFGDLLLHGELEIVSSTQSDAAKKYQCYLFSSILICCKVIRPNKSALVSDKPEFISKHLILKPTQPEPDAKPIPTKKPRFWSKLWCFGSTADPDPKEHDPDLENENGITALDLSAKENPPSSPAPRLKLKGRVFMKDITEIQPYRENGRGKLRVDWKPHTNSDAKQYFIVCFRRDEMYVDWVEKLKELVGR